MPTLRKRIEQRLLDEICTQYPWDEPGGKVPMECRPLMNRLDEIIEVISGIRDYSIEPYMDRVRQVVCANCMQDEEGYCAHRSQNKCALDKHFAKIVAILEEEFRKDPAVS